jgi:hypothetical protein
MLQYDEYHEELGPPFEGDPFMVERTFDGTDCNDGSTLINPDGEEDCRSSDENCNGLINDDDLTMLLTSSKTWHEDADGDSYGAGEPVYACDDPGVHWVRNNNDCDDTDDTVGKCL